MLMSDERRAPPLAFRALLTGLEAAGEETRLRILCLLEVAELTVSELVAILAHSAPRGRGGSRHATARGRLGLLSPRRTGRDAGARMAAPSRSGRSDRER